MQSTVKPISTIRLPKSSSVSLSDAYEETQVLHSFGIVDEEGDVWLAYLDSESDKELVVAAVRPPPPSLSFSFAALNG